MPFLYATRLMRQGRATSPPIPEDLEIVTKRQILRQDIVQPEEPEPEVQFLFGCRRPAANRSHNKDRINKATPQVAAPFAQRPDQSNEDPSPPSRPPPSREDQLACRKTSLYVHGEQSNDVQRQQTTKHKGDLAEDLAKLNSQFKDLVDKAYPDMKTTVLEAWIEARKDLEKRANARSSETRNQPTHTSGGSEGDNRQSQTLVSIKREVIDLDEELQKRDETIQELQERDETIEELQESNQTMEEPSLPTRQLRPTLCLPPRATPTEANKKRRGAPLKAELPLLHVLRVPIAENQWEWVDYNSVCEELTTIFSDDLVKMLVRDEGKRKEWASMTRNCIT
jgi:hypothetical protein